MNNTEEANWYAVYVRYKCEKLVAELLVSKGIETYLPLKTVFRIWGKQKRKKLLPLITSYVFVKIDPTEFFRVLETDKVMNFVKFTSIPETIPEDEINILKRIVGDLTLDVTANLAPLVKGDKVEFIGGTLTGLNGILKDLRGNRQVVVELEHLGYRLTITSNRKFIMPAR